MCRYTVSSLCAGAVFANRPGMLYSCSEDILQVWQLSNSHYPSFKFLPQKGAMADQAHHSWAGAVSDNLYAMPYVPARGTHVTNKENNNEKQTIHY